ncbi:MAG: amidase [Candidatus Hodarchaeales archaeon]|jgi:fatty acid amide hydrolase
MSLDAITDLTATELALKIKEKEFSVQEVIEAYINRIEEVNGQLNAVCVPLFEEARSQAIQADKDITEGKKIGPLHGVPITIKEQYAVAGTETNLGVPNQRGNIEAKDGPLVARLRQAGAIILGKTNIMMTLAGWESDNPVYGRTNNPWNLNRTPGGSSGGEGAIIAARGSPLGFGGDFGGSIRLPSHFCGLHGLKPTSGRLTNADVPSHLFSSGQETIVPQPGPMARSVADLELMMEVLANPPLERTPDHTPPVPWPDPDSVLIKGLKVAMYTDNGVIPISPAIQRAVEESAAVLKEKGAIIKRFTFPEEEIGWKLYLEVIASGGTESLPKQLAGSEPNDLLKEFIRGSTMPGLIRRIFVPLMNRRGQKHLASTVRSLSTRSSVEYWQLIERVNKYRERFLKALEKDEIDIILCPACAIVAPQHGYTRHLLPPPMSYSILYNLMGMPAGVVSVSRVKEGEETDPTKKISKDQVGQIVLEVEKDSVGLPVGVQVVGWHWREDVVLKVMEVLEENFKANGDYPPNQKLLRNS